MQISGFVDRTVGVTLLSVILGSWFKDSMLVARFEVQSTNDLCVMSALDGVRNRRKLMK